MVPIRCKQPVMGSTPSQWNPFDSLILPLLLHFIALNGDEYWERVQQSHEIYFVELKCVVTSHGSILQAPKSGI